MRACRSQLWLPYMFLFQELHLYSGCKNVPPVDSVSVLRLHLAALRWKVNFHSHLLRIVHKKAYILWKVQSIAKKRNKELFFCLCVFFKQRKQLNGALSLSVLVSVTQWLPEMKDFFKWRAIKRKVSGLNKPGDGLWGSCESRRHQHLRVYYEKQ